jgi:integrase
MSATTINRALEYMGYAGRLSGHGFRTTASTLLHEHGFRPDVIEKQLAHEQRNRVAGTYNKAQYLKERQEMMCFWSDFVEKAHGFDANSAQNLA